MQFPSALDLVVNALERLRETSERAPRASRLCIEQLLEARAQPLEGHASPFPKPDLGAADAAPSTVSKVDALGAINSRVAACTKCPHLVSSRTQTVFGVGNADA